MRAHPCVQQWGSALAPCRAWSCKTFIALAWPRSTVYVSSFWIFWQLFSILKLYLSIMRAEWRIMFCISSPHNRVGWWAWDVRVRKCGYLFGRVTIHANAPRGNVQQVWLYFEVWRRSWGLFCAQLPGSLYFLFWRYRHSALSPSLTLSLPRSLSPSLTHSLTISLPRSLSHTSWHDIFKGCEHSHMRTPINA